MEPGISIRYNPRRKAFARCARVCSRMRGFEGKFRGKLRTQRRAAYPTNHRPRKQAQRPHPETDTPIWSEVLCAAEILLLHATPVYYGFGVPKGDGSAV